MTDTRQTRRAVVCAVATTVILLGGCTSSAPNANDTTSAGTGFAAIPGIVERVEPSVVTISTAKGSGSGVIFRSDGIVVTNAHVVAESNKVRVEFADQSTSYGTVEAKDAVTDLAIVKVDRSGLPAAEFETTLPVPGELVLAMGAPLGFDNSVTAGIISGLSRQIPGSAARSKALVDLIQTDAAISPGNSGGALVNSRGEVVGINEAYIPPQAGAVSLGFAIPAATVTDVVGQLLEDGTADHPFVGIRPARLTERTAEALGLENAEGVLVGAVVKDGPAARVGVRPGDVITALGTKEVDSVEDFLAALRDVDPGQRIDLRVERAGRGLTLALTAGELPA
ncbi:S1C family serine protease [Kribbella deserti]|uniref:S1C family serine protease n=1 Tax=Kribbella deserti TaxID=1926257 RepID=A0ABV6QF81_9ACTN